MLCEKIIQHKYKKQIDKMCFADEPATKIVNWVNNTIDADASIATDERMDHYIKEADVRTYKKVLSEKSVEMALRIKKSDGETIDTTDTPITAVQVMDKDISARVVSLSDNKVLGALIQKDAERNILDVNITLQNMLREAEVQYDEVKNLGDDMGAKKVMLGIMTEIRNIIKDYSKILGVEEYLKEKARAKANQHGDNVLSEDKRNALRDVLREVLSKVDIEKVPTILNKLDGILGDIDASIH